MEVLDDMKLGYLIRKHGLRQRVYSGLDDLEVDWAQSLTQIVGAMEKNWFAALEYRTWQTALLVVFVWGTWLGALLAPLYAGDIGWLATGSLAAVSWQGIFAARQFGWIWTTGACCTLGWLFFSLSPA